MELFDTHAHLDDEKFRGDLPQVLARAAEAHVTRIVTVATTAASSRISIELSKQYACLAASVGIQPNVVAEASADAWDEVTRLAEDPQVVAVGETGLDRHW